MPLWRAAFLLLLLPLTVGCGLFKQLEVDSPGHSVQKPSNVALYFSVEDNKGAPIGGLAAESFKIYEDDQLISPFESKPAEDLLETGFVQREGSDQVYYAPDADVLLSTEFLRRHCFRQVRSDREQLLGLAFEPQEETRLTDISGTMWLNPETAELTSLNFRYENLNLGVEIDRLKNDPKYIESVARKDFGMIGQDEIVVKPQRPPER